MLKAFDAAVDIEIAPKLKRKNLIRNFSTEKEKKKKDLHHAATVNI